MRRLAAVFLGGAVALALAGKPARAQLMLEEDQVWKADVLHVIAPSGLVVVPPGVTLTIEPGAVVQFSDCSGFLVDDAGTCNAYGVQFIHTNDVESSCYVIDGHISTDATTIWPKYAQSTVSGLEKCKMAAPCLFKETAIASNSLYGSSVHFWDAETNAWITSIKNVRGWPSFIANRQLAANELFLFRHADTNVTGFTFGEVIGVVSVSPLPSKEYKDVTSINFAVQTNPASTNIVEYMSFLWTVDGNAMGSERTFDYNHSGTTPQLVHLEAHHFANRSGDPLIDHRFDWSWAVGPSWVVDGPESVDVDKGDSVTLEVGVQSWTFNAEANEICYEDANPDIVWHDATDGRVVGDGAALELSEATGTASYYAVVGGTVTSRTATVTVTEPEPPAATTTTPVPVPYSWLDAYPAAMADASGDYEKAAMEDFDGDGKTAWEEYVSETDPENHEDVFRVTEFKFEDGQWVVECQPKDELTRGYRVETVECANGKYEPADGNDGESRQRFFRVGAWLK